jgi:hypothetical protein
MRFLRRLRLCFGAQAIYRAGSLLRVIRYRNAMSARPPLSP